MRCDFVKILCRLTEKATAFVVVVVQVAAGKSMQVGGKNGLGSTSISASNLLKSMPSIIRIRNNYDALKISIHFRVFFLPRIFLQFQYLFDKLLMEFCSLYFWKQAQK